METDIVYSEYIEDENDTFVRLPLALPLTNIPVPIHHYLLGIGNIKDGAGMSWHVNVVPRHGMFHST